MTTKIIEIATRKTGGEINKYQLWEELKQCQRERKADEWPRSKHGNQVAGVPHACAGAE